MASKWEKLFEHLEANGRRAPATVLDVSNFGSEVSKGGFSVLDFVGLTSSDSFHIHKTKLRIRPEGEPEFEAEAKMAYGSGAIPDPGEEIEVLYDPGDPEKVMVAPRRPSGEPGQLSVGASISFRKKKDRA